MSPRSAVELVYRQYAKFNGRASRSELWWFVLFFWAALFLLLAARAVLLTVPVVGVVVGLGLVLFPVANIVPSLAVQVRRLHDTNRSGWWVLLNLVPLGHFVLLLFFLLPGDRGDNDFGPEPLARSSPEPAGSYENGPAPADPRLPVPPAEPSGRYCVRCGTESRPEAVFCRSCGHRL